MKTQSRKRSMGWCYFLVPWAVGEALVPPQEAAAGPSCMACSSPQSCVFDDLDNLALGAATLSVNPACHLLVSNIGSTGNDGVSLAMPSDTGLVMVNFACPNFVQSQTGDKETVTVYGNVPGGIYYTMTVENIGNDTVEIRPDFSSVGATKYTVTVLNNGVVTGIFPDLPFATIQTGECDQEEFC